MCERRRERGGLCCGGLSVFFWVNFGCKFVVGLGLILAGCMSLVSARDLRYVVWATCVRCE